MTHHARGTLIGPILAAVLGSLNAACDSGPGDSGDRVAAISLVQDLRIDAYEHDLVPISWIGVSPAGVMAVFQGQDFNVSFFDSDGAFLTSVGGEGEGPGEFRRLVRAGWIADTLWISDTFLRRATLISPELEFLRSVRYLGTAQPLPADTPRFSAYSAPSPYAMFDDESSLVWGLTSRQESPERDLGGSPVFRITSDGYIKNLVGVIPLSEEAGVTIRLANGGAVFGQVPFIPTPAWPISPHGNRFALLTTDMTADPPTYSVFVADATGDTVYERSFPFEPEPVGPGAVDSAIAPRLERADPSLRGQLRSMLLEAAPDHHPEAEEVVIGMDDRVWVGMRERPEGQRWLVLSTTGDPMGEVLLPPGVSLKVADDEHIWCTELDEFNVASVVRFTLVSARVR